MSTLANVLALIALVLAIVFVAIGRLELFVAILFVLLATAILLKPPPPIG